MIARYDTIENKKHNIHMPVCDLNSVSVDIIPYVLAKEIDKRYNAKIESLQEGDAAANISR